MAKIYDDQQTDNDQLRKITGIDKDTENKIDKKAIKKSKSDVDADINQLEDSFSQPAISDSERNTVGNEDGFYTGSPKSAGTKSSFFQKIGLKIKENPKKSAGIGAGAGLLASLGFVGIISLGPLQFIQFAQMIQNFHFSSMETNSSKRIRNLINYSKWAAGKGGLENTRLGAIEAYRAKKIDNKLAKSGLTSTFDNSGKFTGLEIDQKNMPDSLKKELKDVKNADERAKIFAKHYEVDPSSIKVGQPVKIEVSGTKNSRKLYAKALEISPEYNKVTSAYAKRILIKRANITYNPVTRVKEDSKTKLANKYDQWREDRRARLKGEAPEIDTSRKTKTPDEKASEKEKASTEKVNEWNAETETAAEDIKSGKKIDLKGLMSKSAGPMVVIGLLCTARDVSGEVADQQIDNKIIPMMQASAEVVSVGSKIMAGNDVDASTLGELNKSLNTKGSSWSSSTSIQNELGNDTTGRTLESHPELNPDEKSAAQNLDSVFNELPEPLNTGVSSVCGIYNYAGSLFDSVLNIATGGIAGKLQEATIGKISSAIFGFLSGEPIDLTEEQYAGEAFGEATNVGGRVLANESAMSMGGEVLSQQESASNKQYLASLEKKSIKERYFDIYNPTSTVGRVAMDTYSGNNTEKLSKIPNLISRNISSIINTNASAEGDSNNSTYYNIPEVGFEITKLEKDIYENPYANALTVKDAVTKDPGLLELFTECTGVNVDENLNFDNKSVDEGVVAMYLKADYPSKCKEDNNEMLYRLRVLALDTTLLESLSCLEFDDIESCEEINPTAPDANTSDGGAFIMGDYAWPVSIFKKDIDSGYPWPCPGNCHHDGSPAFDLSDKKTVGGGDDSAAVGQTVYAITDGYMWNTKIYNGIEGCYGFHIKGTDGYDYYYAHLSNPITKNTDRVKVKKGDKVAEIGRRACTGNGSYPHLHIDQSKEYYHAVGSRTDNLVKILNDLYKQLPDEAPTTTEEGDGVATGDFAWPLAGSPKDIGTDAGPRVHPILGYLKCHAGADVGAQSGDKIKAADGGKVKFAGWSDGYGNYVEIKHSDGVETHYGHMVNKPAVKTGQNISKGQLIGNVGSTGLSTGPHLHFEVVKDGKYLEVGPWYSGKVVEAKAPCNQ
jgi:murein DD-endopeptidase MepM/ murein hydrolase activator NlpD